MVGPQEFRKKVSPMRRITQGGNGNGSVTSTCQWFIKYLFAGRYIMLGSRIFFTTTHLSSPTFDEKNNAVRSTFCPVFCCCRRCRSSSTWLFSFSWIYEIYQPVFNFERLYKSVVNRAPQEEFSSTALPTLPLRTVLLLRSNSQESRFINFFFTFMMSKLYFLSPGNHTVTQSTFASPCEPETGGFDSGWVFVPSGETDIPEWNLTITDDSKRPFAFLFGIMQYIWRYIYSYLVLLQAASARSPLHFR